MTQILNIVAGNVNLKFRFALIIAFFCLINANLVKKCVRQKKVLITYYLVLEWNLILPNLIPDEERHLTSIFIFTLLFSASKVFMKPFKAPERSVKMRI